MITLNIDNEVLINAFQEEMIRSNNNSKWWKNHLSEQINNLFGNSLEQSTKEAILSSAKAFIESGALEATQYFYQTKEINEKKEIFAKANLYQKNHIFNIIPPEDKEPLINNNEYIKLNDLSKKLDEFFDIYSSTIGKPTESIGVWISGFFGSGKSHFLKILSYILSNQRIHSDLIGELFIQKIGQEDFELKNNPKMKELK